MNETRVTVIGHVANEPTQRMTRGGIRVVTFRLGSTERKYDNKLGGWRDGDSVFWTVTCWRNLGENVMDSLKKGDPVVVFGRIKDGGYEGKDGVRRTIFEIDATAIGHDLSRGVSRFTKASVVPGERDLVPGEDIEGSAMDADEGPIHRPAPDSPRHAPAPTAA